MKIKSLLATGLMVAGLSTSAFAQEIEVTPFVSGWFNAFQTNTTGGSKENKFSYNVSEYSTAGLTFERGNLSGEFTLKLNKDNYLKRAYVQYNLSDDQSILVGINETLAWYNFGQVSNDYNALINFGALSDNTRPQIRWSGYGLNVALLSKGINVSGADDGLKLPTNITSNHTNVVNDDLPRVDVSYDILTDFMQGAVFASYAPYMYSYNIGNSEESILVNSIVVGFGGHCEYDKLFADATVYFGMNAGMIGALSSGQVNPSFTAKGNEIEVENSTAFGGALAVGYAINDTYTPSVGFGYATSSLDKAENNSYAVYANVAIAITDGLTLIPEVAYTNSEDDNGAGNKTETGSVYAGAILEFAF